MSLVIYDNSSDSENEENIFGNICKETVKPHSNNVKSSISDTVADKLLFTNIPQSHMNTFDIKRKVDDLLKEKRVGIQKRQSVKISIPFVSDFQSDSFANKRQRKELTKSGLLALLPAPKQTALSNVSFLPKIVQINQKAAQHKIHKIDSQNNSDNEDGYIAADYTLDDDLWQKACGKRQRVVKSIGGKVTLETLQNNASRIIDLAPAIQKPYDGLNNEAFKKLVGNRKKIQENIKLIDVYEDDIRSGDKLLIKSLTDPNSQPNTEAENVNNTRKMKNHITSLARNALVNDRELQMQWAENRHKRRLTQAKYGF